MTHRDFRRKLYSNLSFLRSTSNKSININARLEYVSYFLLYTPETLKDFIFEPEFEYIEIFKLLCQSIDLLSRLPPGNYKKKKRSFSPFYRITLKSLRDLSYEYHHQHVQYWEEQKLRRLMVPELSETEDDDTDDDADDDIYEDCELHPPKRSVTM